MPTSLPARARLWLERPPVQLGLVALVVAVMFGFTLNVGEFWRTDEARHAMDGVWLMDVMHDFPLAHLYDYTIRYVAQYPALGLSWYPPFFALIEALVFSVAGISEVAARMTVLLFILLGALVWFAWMRSRFGLAFAWTSSLLLLTTSEFVYWGRSVMLEVPAVAMMILSAFAFLRFLDRPTSARSIVAGTAIAAALLLKQTSAILLPVLLLVPLVSGDFKVLLRRESLPGTVLVLLSVAFLIAHALLLGSLGLQVTLGGLHQAGAEASRASSARWLLHLRVLLRAWPMAVLALAGSGIALAVVSRGAREDLVFGLWLLCWYLLFTLLLGAPEDAMRYTLYAAPPVAYFACRPLIWIAQRRAYRAACLALLLGAVAWQATPALYQPALFTSGYADAARIALSETHSGTMLFAGKHDGNFIFHVREHDPQHKRFVLRADKILVSMSVQKYFGTRSYVKTAQDVVDILDRFGVSTIVIEDPDVVGLDEFKLLKTTLDRPGFTLISRIPVKTNVDEFSNLSVLIYSYRNPSAAQDDLLIPLPLMGRELRVPRSALKQDTSP